MGLLCPSSSPCLAYKWAFKMILTQVQSSSFRLFIFFMCILSCMCYSFTYHIHIMSVIIILVQLLKLLLSFAHIETTQRRSFNKYVYPHVDPSIHKQKKTYILYNNMRLIRIVAGQRANNVLKRCRRPAPIIISDFKNLGHQRVALRNSLPFE